MKNIFLISLLWGTCAVCHGEEGPDRNPEVAEKEAVNAPGVGDEILLARAKEGFRARASAGGLTNKEAAVPAFRKPFEGFDDAQKIKALALYLYDIDQNDEKWSMSTAIIMAPLYALSDDPDFIKDWSALRQMLQDERDPRKFYLLSKLVPSMKSEPQLDFIAERTHMLFADGRVAKDEGEYTRSYAHDVSQYAYTAIAGNLRVLGADFEPPAENFSHVEKAVILAKWLKENWARCENIEIPARLLGDASRLPSRTHAEDELQIGQQEEGAVDDYYKVVGPRKIPMDIPKDIVIKRIDDGVSKMKIETNIVRLNERILTIEDAYKRMIGTIIFIGGIFPEWGVDHGDCFVFSGQPNISK